ncbi:MAG TPA: hypothetical protein VIG77_10270, partial [Ktedonobacterales bacterium]
MWDHNAGQGMTPQQANQRAMNRPYAGADEPDEPDEQAAEAGAALDALTADDAAYAALSARGAGASVLTEAMRRA